MKTTAYTLVGVDSNAFSIMGYTMKAMRAANMDSKEISAYQTGSMSGDYDHVISASMDMLNKVNEKLNLTEEDS